jgi:hypothetical protein
MCMVDYNDDDGGVWFGTTKPRANKEHVCGNCCRTIAKGETYARSSWVYDGYVSVFKMCSHCEAAASWLVKVCGGFICGDSGQVPGGLPWEDLQEHWDDHAWPIRSLDLGRLLVGLKRGWKRRDGQLWPVELVQAWATTGAQMALAVPA